jgi:hypothetical protein
MVGPTNSGRCYHGCELRRSRTASAGAGPAHAPAGSRLDADEQAVTAETGLASTAAGDTSSPGAPARRRTASRTASGAVGGGSLPWTGRACRCDPHGERRGRGAGRQLRAWLAAVRHGAPVHRGGTAVRTGDELVSGHPVVRLVVDGAEDVRVLANGRHVPVPVGCCVGRFRTRRRAQPRREWRSHWGRSIWAWFSRDQGTAIAVPRKDPRSKARPTMTSSLTRPEIATFPLGPRRRRTRPCSQWA